MLQDCNQDEMTRYESRQAAITELYQRYASPLLLYLRRHAASIEDAEDLLLDTFQAALLQEHLLESGIRALPLSEPTQTSSA